MLDNLSLRQDIRVLPGRDAARLLGVPVGTSENPQGREECADTLTVTLTGDQAFLAVLVILFFMSVAYGPALKRWLNKADPVDIGGPPKKEL